MEYLLVVVQLSISSRNRSKNLYVWKLFITKINDTQQNLRQLLYVFNKAMNINCTMNHVSRVIHDPRLRRLWRRSKNWSRSSPLLHYWLVAIRIAQRVTACLTITEVSCSTLVRDKITKPVSKRLLLLLPSR